MTSIKKYAISIIEEEFFRVTYKEAVEYLESFIDYEKIPVYPYKTCIDLARMNQLLELLGNPQQGLRAVHIAGTKGKGSIACMTASILTEAGFKTGLYTSPHLIDFKERIRVDKVKIRPEQVVGLAVRIKDLIGTEPFTFFEVYTGLAFMYFKECQTDFIVLETGLGGRLDATNVVRPDVCGISSISLDHTDKLGQTLEKIAREKAGIIKEGAVVVSAPQEPAAAKVIQDVCLRKKTRLFRVGQEKAQAVFVQDILFELVKSDRDSNARALPGRQQTFNLKGMVNEYSRLELPLLGVYQVVNAAVAVGLVEGLSFSGVKVPMEAVKNGLAKVQWPGRLEVIRDNPKVVLDGAQNKASARALVQAVQENFDYNKLILIFGISKDKDIEGVLRTITPLVDEIILTRADNPRSAGPEDLKKILKNKLKFSANITVIEQMPRAYETALEKARDNDLVLVTGSFFIMGEIPGYKVE